MLALLGFAAFLVIPALVGFGVISIWPIWRNTWHFNNVVDYWTLGFDLIFGVAAVMFSIIGIIFMLVWTVRECRAARRRAEGLHSEGARLV
jgi:hypothetical protein